MSGWDEGAWKKYGLAGAEGIFASENTEQYAVVFDLISEGEIHGLINGPSSIYLNSTPMLDEGIWLTSGPRKTYKASLDTTTNDDRVTVDAEEEFFDNRVIDSTKHQYLLLEGAGKSTTSSGGVTFAGTSVGGPVGNEAQTLITASGSFFTEAMATGDEPYTPMITIKGAGMGATDYHGYIQRYVSATQAYVMPGIYNSVTTAIGYLDHVSKITAFNANLDYCTLEDAALTSVTTQTCILFHETDITWNPNSEDKEWNYESVGASFNAGTLYQKPMTSFGKAIPTASYLYVPKTQLLQNADYESKTSAPTAWNESGSEETFSGTASDTIVTAQDMSVPSAGLIDQIKITIDFPSGLYSIDNHDGDEGPNWSELQIWFEYVEPGANSFTSKIAFGRETLMNSNGVLEDPDAYGWTGPNRQASNAFIVSGPTHQAFAEEFLIDATPFQPFDDWRIRIKKVNSDNFRKGSNSWTMYGVTILQALEAQITDKLSYPLTAYAGVTFSAEDFKTFPIRQYHVKGLKVQVPSNYLTRDETNGAARYERNPSTGVDAGSYQDWDGNFRGDFGTFSESSVNHNKMYCNNPAWVFYDLCINPVYGLGSIITDNTLVDKYALYKIARYCDELVPDGEGGTEPRFTCNHYISKTGDAYKVLSDFASIFRGMLYWMNGQLTPVQDRLKLPLYTFNQTNVMTGTFAYQGSSDRQKPNQIIVSWNNPKNKFLQEVEIVEDVENIVRTKKIKTKSVAGFGCTSQAQAHRLGQWMLLVNKLETEVVTFQTATNAAFVRPGDVINIQDGDRKKIQFSGRVSNEGTRDMFNIPLDREITLYPNSNYTLHVVFGTGGAFIGQDSADINGITYLRGDIILKDKNGASIDTELKSLNVQDDSSTPIRLEWVEDARVENQLVNFAGLDGTPSSTDGSITTKALPVLSAFSSVPPAEVIWALTSDERDSNETKGAQKTIQYKIVSVTENSDETYDISALLYDRTKYDQIEKGYRIDTPAYDIQPDRLIAIPPPSSLSVNFSRGSNMGYQGVVGGAGGTGVSATISWGAPKTAKTSEAHAKTFLNGALTATSTSIVLQDGTNFSSSGIVKINEEFIKYTSKSTNTLTGLTRGAYSTISKSHTNNTFVFQAEELVDSEVSWYELKHNLSKDNSTKKRRVRRTVITIDDVRYGWYTIQVRAVSKGTQKSIWQTVKGEFKIPSHAPLGRFEKLPRGGHMTGSFILNTTSGNVNTAADNYTFTNHKGKQHIVTSATTAQEIQAFSGLASSGEGYLIHDSSNTTDPWVGANIFTDNIVSSNSIGATTTLAEALDASETSIDVASVSNLGAKGTIRVDSEDITYTGITSTTLTGCTRGANSTTAATHSNGATVYYGLLNFKYWKEIGASNNGLTLGSGTATVAEFSHKVTGSGTNFDGDFVEGDLVRFASTNDYVLKTNAIYGEVFAIISDTEMYLKEASPIALSGVYCYYQSWKPDIEEDTVCAKITRTS